MTTNTFWFLNSSPTGYNGFALQEDGSAPGAASAGGAWTVGTTAATAYSLLGYSTGRNAASFGGSSQLTSNPENTSGAADCARSQNALTTAWDAGTWAFTMSVMGATAHSQRGHFQIKMWASANANGSSPRELTSGTPIAGSECPAISSSFTPYSANISWSAPAVNLTAEYLFVQIEWVIDVAGTSSSDDIHLYISLCSFVTANITAAPTGTLAAVDGSDAAALAGSVAWLAALAAVDGPDIAAFAGPVPITGTLAAVDGADAVAFAGTAVDPNAHSYWRIKYVTAQNFTSNVIAEVQFRGVSGGPTLTTGGTAIADSDQVGFEAAKAFDGNNDATQWFSNTNGSTSWIGYHFASSVDIVEVALFPHGTYGPSSFNVDYSDDGTTWTTLYFVSTSQTSAWIISGGLGVWTYSPPAPTGTLAAVDGSDAASLSGSVAWMGALAAIEGADVASFTGPIPITGTLAAVEAHDTPAFAGHGSIIGTLAAVEAHDTPAFVGAVSAAHLVAVGLTTGSPRFGLPTVRQVVPLPNATALVPGSPVFGTPAAAQLPTHLTLGSPIFGFPAIHQTHRLHAADLVTGSPALGGPRSHMIYSPVTPGVFLPENIERAAQGSAGRFNTSIFIGANGAEARSINWPRSIGKWSITLGYRDDDDADFLATQAAFYASRGNGYGFLFKDWSDYRATGQPISPIAGTSLFQLQKVYNAGVATYARKITRPRAGTVLIRLDDAPQGGVTIDYTTGILTGASAGMLATFEFWVPVRFDSDTLSIEVEHDGVLNVTAIDLCEILE